tara:strand:+ start:205 stop:918 length:714 start_codon:yes stop_codon:yes gene_type:complete
MIFRLIELKILEPLLFFLKFFFKTEQEYFKMLMSLRYVNRKIFAVPLTSNHIAQYKKFNYFKKMIRKDKVLEIGCGNLGLGYHLIKYLNKNNYCGVDINKYVIKNSIKLINSNPNIKKKKPKIHLVHNIKKVNSLAENYNSNVFVFSSVFTHMSKNKILEYLRMIKNLKNNKTLILADFSISKFKHSYNVRRINYYYSITDVKKILSIFDNTYKIKSYKINSTSKNYESYLFVIKRI